MPGTVIRNHPRQAERAEAAHDPLQRSPYRKVQGPIEGAPRGRRKRSHPALRLGLVLVLAGLLFAVFAALARLAVLPAPPPAPPAHDRPAAQDAGRPS